MSNTSISVLMEICITSLSQDISIQKSVLSSPQDLLEDYKQSSDDDLDIVSVIYPDYYDDSSESRGQKGVLYGKTILKECILINCLKIVHSYHVKMPIIITS